MNTLFSITNGDIYIKEKVYVKNYEGIKTIFMRLAGRKAFDWSN